MLYLIGLGLSDKDISIRGIEALKKSEKVYAEFYTSPNVFDLEELEEEVDKEIELLDRGEVEKKDKILESARERKTAFLVSGDPLTATTHYDIYYRSRREGIETEVVHAPSIFTAAAETGLSLYKLGRTTTLPKKEKDYLPDSPYEIIKNNLGNGLHSLLLLDPGLSPKRTYKILKELEEKKEDGIFVPDRNLFLLEGIGDRDSNIQMMKFEELPEEASREKPLTIIIPADLSHEEEKFTKQFL